MNQVRKGLGIEPVPVPTGRSTAGPGTLRPTNRPTRPRAHPSDPMTEVLGRQIERHGRTGVLPGMGAGPTMNVNGRRPAVERARPGFPPHIAGAAPVSPLAIILLLAVTIGAVGWWLGSGRWTQVPELIGQEQSAAIDLLQGRGAGPRLLRGAVERGVPRGGPSCRPNPKAGEAIRGTDVRLVVSKGPERFRVDPALVGSLGRRRAETPGGTAGDPVHHREEYDDGITAGRGRRVRPARRHRYSSVTRW